MTLLRTLLVALLAALALAAPASAARDQEATFQDDEQLIYTDRAQRERNLDTLARLGVDRIRVTVLWKAIAPDPQSRTRPNFDATNPDAYPRGIWDHYDHLVVEARERGMDVNFNVTGPAPLWATKVAPRPDIVDRYEPSPVEFAQFVAAVGRRYSGQWPPSDYALPGGKLPRVGYWSIWNEPNHSGWLTPTWDKRGGKWVERSASLYRELAGAAWAALGATGHGTDVFLVGETAPSGDRSKNVKRYMKPLIFVRALYCVNRRLRPLRGAAAARLGCPRDGKGFRDQHPALFRATGYAHHPYQLLLPPGFRPTDRDYVTIGVLRRMTRTLDRVFRRYGSRRHLGLYLTEYGYQTPPDPLGVPLATQAAFLNLSEYIAWRNRRVKTLSQFLLVDDGEPIGLTFQSGLRTIGGKDKPAFRAYRMPVWVTGRGSRTRVWGVVRPAAAGERVRARIEYRRKGTKKWRLLRTVRTSAVRNSFLAKVRVPRRRGAVRVSWNDLHSRTVRVR